MKLEKNTNENKIIDTIESTNLGLELATSTLTEGRSKRLSQFQENLLIFLRNQFQEN